MPAPSLSKTWQFNVNQYIKTNGSFTSTAARLIRAIKDSLIGFSLSPWQTVASCGDSTVGANLVAGSVVLGVGDGIDRWTNDGYIIWAAPGSNHSWYILKQTGINNTFQVCIDCVSAYDAISIVISPGGLFNGGSRTNRPTASDELVILNGVSTTWGMSSGSFVNTALHVMQSTDGYCTRIILMSSCTPVGYISFEVPAFPVTGWTNPVIVTTKGSGTNGNIFNPSNIGSATMSVGNSPRGGLMALAASCDNHGGIRFAYSAYQSNSFSGEYPVFPVIIHSTTTGSIGTHGMFSDLWFGMSSLQLCMYYPDNTSRQFVQIGNLVFPWDGSAIQIC